jgi:transcription elongation factor GreA
LSENFEYHAAKKVKNQNEGRIRYLERMIKTAVVIEDESAEDEIGINDTVDILVIEDNSLETYKLVTTVRGDSLNGLISVESPMGKALLSHKVGDTVSIKVNENFSYDVIVKRIEKSDDENDKMRNY